MGSVLERGERVAQSELRSRRRHRLDWMKARSDGIAGGFSGFGVGVAAWFQSRDNPIPEQFINPLAWGFFVGAAVGFVVFLITAPVRLRSEKDVQQESQRRNEVAAHARRQLRRRQR